MPQMRAVMSGASVNRRPRRNASNRRGGSKMRNFTSAIRPLRTCTSSPPSPSTRASIGTLMFRVLRSLMGLARVALVLFAGLAEGLGPAGEAAEEAHQLVVTVAVALEHRAQGPRVGAAADRAEAPEA